jgi:LAO/AO transport system kinase
LDFICVGDFVTRQELLLARQGSRRDLARLLSLIEDGSYLFDDTSRIDASRDMSIAITGSPGVGKSVLCDQLLSHWASSGYNVALLAVDPSSPRSGGALLGDRIRLKSIDDAEIKDRIYVRSIATRKSTGSVPLIVRDMAALLHDVGYQRVLIETVGAGQSELRCAAVADRIVLVEGPARGDSIQAEKAGLLELADAVVVNKADIEGARKHFDELKESLALEQDELPQMFLVSALEQTGTKELAEQLFNLASTQRAKKSRIYQHLLASHEQRLTQHPRLNEVLDLILEGTLHIDDALSHLNGSS